MKRIESLKSRPIPTDAIDRIMYDMDMMFTGSFKSDAPNYWIEFEKIVIKLIENGNPLNIKN